MSVEDAAARRRNEFSLRFFQALNPVDDLGPTEEEHQMAVARNVFVVHADLNVLGEEVYSDVWSTLSAPNRAAIKKYVAMCLKD